MGSLSGAISQMAILILIAAMGFVSAKIGYIDMDIRAKLTKILVNITLPCMIVISANDLDPSSVQGLIPLAFLLATIQFALLLLCGMLCNTILRTPKNQKSLYLFMAICTNSAFIGLPVISSLYGGETVLFASIFVMVLAFFKYRVGFAILTGQITKREKTRARNIFHQGWLVLAGLPWRSIINPSMLSCLLAIAMLLVGFRVPTTLAEAMNTLGGITTPIAMMLVGSLVADADIKSMVKEFRMYPFILIKQLIIPIGLLFGLRALGVNEALVVVFVIMFAMPIGSMASAFAEEFGRDSMLAAKGTVLSTAASFAIVPVIVAAMAP